MISLFLDLCRDADPILGTPFIDRFLYYATFRHYAAVRPLLQTMLALQDQEAQASAARQICLASFHDREAQEDIKLVDTAAESARAAAAQVYAANLRQKHVGDLCRERLRACFHDGSDKVREAAAGCFRQITDVQLSQETELIAAFIWSPAFRDGANQLLFAVEWAGVQRGGANALLSGDRKMRRSRPVRSQHLHEFFHQLEFAARLPRSFVSVLCIEKLNHLHWSVRFNRGEFFT